MEFVAIVKYDSSIGLIVKKLRVIILSIFLLINICFLVITCHTYLLAFQRFRY